MCMMTRMHTPANWRRRKDILLCILSMTSTWRQGRARSPWRIVQELPTVDYILVPVGGGGLISGVATLAKMLNPKIKVVGVEPAEAASMSAALQAGEVVELDSANTIADGTAVKAVGDKILPYVQENVDECAPCWMDDELIGAFLDNGRKPQMIVEKLRTSFCGCTEAAGFKGEKSCMRAERGEYGRHHHVFHCTARSDPERQNLLCICTAFGQAQVSLCRLLRRSRMSRGT